MNEPKAPTKKQVQHTIWELEELQEKLQFISDISIKMFAPMSASGISSLRKAVNRDIERLYNHLPPEKDDMPYRENANEKI